MAEGRDYKVFISETGLSDGTPVEVELQGDLTINPGKTTNTTKYKNGTTTNQNDAGFTASFNMGNAAPLATGEALVWSSHDSGGQTYIWIKNSRTGGIEWALPAKLAIQSVATPVNGDPAVSVTIGADGDVTRSVKSA